MIIIHNGEKKFKILRFLYSYNYFILLSEGISPTILQQLSDGEVQKKLLAHIYVAPSAKSCVTKQAV